MYLIELLDYTIAPIGKGNGLNKFYFALSRGDACSISTDSADDAHLFLKALTTLVYPVEGIYRFKGEPVDFSDYRSLLSCKKKIGYIAPDSAMISNITVRENLLLKRYYFENSHSLSLNENVLRLCSMFDICDKLDLRPAMLTLIDLRIAITIREMTKPPDLLLLERPEDFIGHTKFSLFKKILKDMLLSKIPIVFISYDRNFVEAFSNKKILINGGKLTTVSG